VNRTFEISWSDDHGKACAARWKLGEYQKASGDSTGFIEKYADISARRRALDLLFVMCDTDNAERIVDELVAHLVLADAAIREETVLKIAISAEKYATYLRWYVDSEAYFYQR
jgi:hypothetical protein